MKKLTLLAAAFGLVSSNAFALEFNIDAGTNNDAQYSTIGSTFGPATPAACTGAGGTVVGTQCATPGPDASQTGTNVANFGFQIDGATSQYYNTNTDAGTSATNVDVGDVFTDNGTGEIFTLEGVNESNENYDDTWSLTFDYTLYGAVIDTGGGSLAGGVAGGYVNIYYNDLTDAAGINEGDAGFDSGSVDAPLKVLSVAITGSSGPLSTSVGLNLYGVIDYSDSVNNDMDTTDGFITDFFNFVDPQTFAGTVDTNFFKLWEAGIAADPDQFIDGLVVTTLNGLNGAAIDEVEDLVYGASAAIDMDKDDFSALQIDIFDDTFGGTASADALLAGSFANVSRTGETLSGNLSFNVVPEPTTLAIFGLSLLGFAGLSRRKS